MGVRQKSVDPDSEQGLTIGDLARLAGSSPQVIRAWETRYDFPQPRRTSSGRRSYHPDDVSRVARVLELKNAGWRLTQAIEHVRQQQVPGGRDLSVYGALRRQLPHLGSQRIRRDALIAISRAIEDEALARAVRPVIFGTFQRAHFYERSAARWQELARTAETCVVLADFADAPDPLGRPVRIGLGQDSPLLREWVVVVSSQDFSAVLSAWEITDGKDDVSRWFETIFSFDPDAVRMAVDTCRTAVRSVESTSAQVLDDLDLATPSPPRTPSAAVDALVMRAFTYLQNTSRT